MCSPLFKPDFHVPSSSYPEKQTHFLLLNPRFRGYATKSVSGCIRSMRPVSGQRGGFWSCFANSAAKSGLFCSLFAKGTIIDTINAKATIPGGMFPVRHHSRPHVPGTTGCLNPHRDIRKPPGTLSASDGFAGFPKEPIIQCPA